MTEAAEHKLDALVARVRKVRRWLVTLAVLKVTALCLLFVSCYVGVYAWLDHRLHFDTIGRIIALALLVAGVVIMLYKLTRLLLGHMSCSSAASYIESKSSFDQQLVTAIEYYENKQDYPYSKALAERLVLQVDQASREFAFDSIVGKWQSYLFGAVIILGLCVGYLYVRETAVYFSRYFTRLVRPLAAVEPLPPTSLEAITADFFVEPGTEVTLSAHIKGRVPEFGKLVLAAVKPDDSNSPLVGSLQVKSYLDEDERPKFEATKLFEKSGQFKYRFEADEAHSQWHKISVCGIPKIKSIKARVTWGDNNYVQPYTEEVKDYTLEVAKDSFVTLTIEATEELSMAVVRGLDGKAQTKQLQGTDKFDYKFIAGWKSFIDFELSSAEGVTNNKLPNLQVLIKPDQSPKLSLISPNGDYVATNVASVPLTFEVTDDFGLDSVTMYLEIAGGKAQVLRIPIEKGARKHRFTHTLELEEHDLTVGDSILFYSRALDIDTGAGFREHDSTSDMYFIEIRPYRQLWHQLKPKLPGQPKQGLKSKERLEFLITILEYTRAILKKTWVIANMPKLTDQDRSRLESINKDVQYCSEQIGLRLNRFEGDSKETLTQIVEYYDQASKHLVRYRASSAIKPEKNAYRLLRKFIVELDKLPPGGSGQPPVTRDRIKLQEQVHLTRYEKERIEWELEQLAQKLAAIAAEQKRLKKTFEKFLAQQMQKQNRGQKTTDEQSWIGKNEKPSKPCPACGGQDVDSCLVCLGAESPQPIVTMEGALKPSPETDPNGMARGKGKGQGQGKGTGKGSKASAEDQLKMLQAEQRALQEQVSGLKQALAELPEIEDAGKGGSHQKAQEHLDYATEQMDKFQDKIAQAFYEPELDQAKLSEAVAMLDLARHGLDLARRVLESQLSLSDEQMLAQEALELAEEMAELADALDSSTSDAEAEQMLARLAEAKRLLEKMSEYEHVSTQDTTGPQGNQPPHEDTTQGQPGLGGQTGQGGLGPGLKGGASAQVNKTKAEVARLVARQFWSIAIKAKKRQGHLIEAEPSDAKFYELESGFFEDAAKFSRESVKK